MTLIQYTFIHVIACVCGTDPVTDRCPARTRNSLRPAVVVVVVCTHLPRAHASTTLVVAVVGCVVCAWRA